MLLFCTTAVYPPHDWLWVAGHGDVGIAVELTNLVILRFAPSSAPDVYAKKYVTCGLNQTREQRGAFSLGRCSERSLKTALET